MIKIFIFFDFIVKLFNLTIILYFILVILNHIKFIIIYLMASLNLNLTLFYLLIRSNYLILFMPFISISLTIQ